MKHAIFGGTFDPIHSAHIEIARTARDVFALDRVLIIPAALPPHKLHRQVESYEHRYRMVELACSGQAGLEPSRLEEGEDKSYSIVTIEKVRSQLKPHDDLFFIIGADAFAEVDTWHRYRDVVASVEFIVVSRPGHVYAAPEEARVYRLTSMAMLISSSDIRNQLSRGHRPAELPEQVFNYICEHGLYSTSQRSVCG